MIKLRDVLNRMDENDAMLRELPSSAVHNKEERLIEIRVTTLMGDGSLYTNVIELPYSKSKQKGYILECDGIFKLKCDTVLGFLADILEGVDKIGSLEKLKPLHIENHVKFLDQSVVDGIRSIDTIISKLCVALRNRKQIEGIIVKTRDAYALEALKDY